MTRQTADTLTNVATRRAARAAGQSVFPFKNMFPKALCALVFTLATILHSQGSEDLSTEVINAEFKLSYQTISTTEKFSLRVSLDQSKQVGTIEIVAENTPGTTVENEAVSIAWEKGTKKVSSSKMTKDSNGETKTENTENGNFDQTFTFSTANISISYSHGGDDTTLSIDYTAGPEKQHWAIITSQGKRTQWRHQRG